MKLFLHGKKMDLNTPKNYNFLSREYLRQSIFLLGRKKKKTFKIFFSCQLSVIDLFQIQYFPQSFRLQKDQNKYLIYMHYFKTLNKNYINIFWNTEKKCLNVQDWFYLVPKYIGQLQQLKLHSRNTMEKNEELKPIRQN